MMTNDGFGLDYKNLRAYKTQLAVTSLRVKEETVLNTNEVRNYSAKAAQDIY